MALQAVMRAAPLAVFASGFAASGLEIVLLLAFQILYGSVYQQLGIIVTVFMAGLAAGAFGMSRTDVHIRSATGLEARSTLLLGAAVIPARRSRRPRRQRLPG